jgi:hypothetical protein
MAVYPKSIPHITLFVPAKERFCTFMGMKRALVVSVALIVMCVSVSAQSNPQSSGQGAPAPATQASPAPAPQTPPRCDTPEHRQFDFWVGEWDVVPKNAKANNKPSSSIQRILADCVIYENYTNGKYEGKSFNIYDRVSKKWHQTWVDMGGALIHFAGGLKNGVMVLEGEQITPQGKVWNKMEYTPNADGTVRQVWTVSGDGGKTWTTAFDGTYHRKK